jgi:hypothetical protein
VNRRAQINGEWDDEGPELAEVPPRTSMFRPAPPQRFESDPRAPYTRALFNLVRVGDIAHMLAPIEIFEAYCTAIAEPLGLVVAVVIEAHDGLPRSMPWRTDDADWKIVEHGESRAWTNFAELLAPDLVASLPPESASPWSDRGLYWTVQPLGVPLLGIIQCGTSRPVEGADNGLLKCMSVRLSVALTRRGDEEALTVRPG